MAEHLSAFVPKGVDPHDEQAACQAAFDCVNAVGQLLKTANHQRRGAQVTESAILRCLYDMDCAVAKAGNFRACNPIFSSSRTAPYAEAAKLAREVQSRWMKAVVEWKNRTEAPSDGWSNLWHLYAQHFGNQVGPTWADAAASVEKSDADEKGLINTARIYIPQEALEHQWHFGAWSFVCEQLKRFDATDLTALVQSLAQLRDSFDKACAKPSSEIVVFLEAVRDEVHYAADAKRQQLARGYSNDTLASMVRGIKWAEAGQRVSALSDLPTEIVEHVARVLRRELTPGTVEQIDELLTPAICNLRDAWECFKGASSPAGDILESLLSVQRELERWNSDNSPSETGYLVEDVPTGHPLHAAVARLQRHYGGALPKPALRHWRKFLKLARNDGEDAEDEAEQLLEWVNGEIELHRAGEQPDDNHAEIRKERGEDQATMRLLSVYTNGLADERFDRVRYVLEDNKLNVDEKLWKIDALMPIPPISAAKLGKLFTSEEKPDGVSKTAIQSTSWYKQNRKGRKDEEIDQREDRLRQRGKTYERDRQADDDE